MSHIASIVSVALLFISIALNFVSLFSPWWKGETPDNLFIGEVSLWDAHLTVQGTSVAAATPWDDICNAPNQESTTTQACTYISSIRAMIILGAIFAFFASTGNAAGMYTGNTLIDSAAGVVAGFSSVFSGLGAMLGYWTEKDGLVLGWMAACIACGLQLVGGFFGCVGTCQEMHEMTMLAASLHLGEFKDPEPYKPRSERSGKIREAEGAEAQEIYNNLAKRKREAEAAIADGDDEENGDKVMKVPVKLKMVLFRKPEEGDDDEIPTKMLEDAFAEIDGDGSGSIELDELVDALKACGLAVSKNATDIVMKEIDKNASGDVDLREFIEFFRHIEDLNRFQKKSAARQQFLSFLLNFCFLADIVVVGVMLMMFIRMDQAANPDNYSILKNVLMACSAFLGILFMAVILIPILRMALGPSVVRLQKQMELASLIKASQQKKAMSGEDDDTGGLGPRQAAGYGPDDPPPPVNAAMFGRSYRPGKVDNMAWTPAIDNMPQPKATNVQPMDVRRGSNQSAQSHQSSNGGTASANVAPRKESKGHSGGKNWRYDPSNYRIAMEHAQMLEAADLGPSGWAPMQMRDVNIPKQTAPAVLPGAPMAITDAAFPQATDARR